MCRILGIKNFVYLKHKELIENFFSLAETWKVLRGDRKGHTDGWGIGYYESGKAVVRRSGKSVIKERDVFFKTIKKIKSAKVLIVHFRKSAWPGTNSKENSQPFRYKNILEHPDFHWDVGLGGVRGEESASPCGVTVPIKSGRQRGVSPYGSIPEGDILFAHNGTIYDYKKLLKEIAPENRPQPNALDSEIYFHYLIDNLSLDIENAFKKSVNRIKKKNKHSSLTCIFTDGNTFYAYREYTKSADYYTLYHSEFGNSEIISSEPISPQLKWQILKKGELFILHSGTEETSR